MGSIVTKNRSNESGICGRAYILLKSFYLLDNSGYNLSHEKYYISDNYNYFNKNIVICPPGSIIFVKNVYSGNNLPDGGSFLEVTGTIYLSSGKIYNGVIFGSDMFSDPTKNANQMKPNLSIVLPTNYQFQYDGYHIPVKKGDRKELLFDIVGLLEILKMKLQDSPPNSNVLPPHIISFINKRQVPFVEIIYNHKINSLGKSEDQIMNGLLEEINPYFSDMSDTDIFLFIYEIYCIIDEVPYNPHLLQYE